MIVKVTLVGKDNAVVTTQDGSTKLSLVQTRVLLARMGDARMKYFQAEMIPGAIDLLDALPDQSW